MGFFRLRYLGEDCLSLLWIEELTFGLSNLPGALPDNGLVAIRPVSPAQGPAVVIIEDATIGECHNSFSVRGWAVTNSCFESRPFPQRLGLPLDRECFKGCFVFLCDCHREFSFGYVVYTLEDQNK